MQYWKHPSLSSELTMTGVEDADGDDVVESGAEYVAMALMWPLQHASRIEELEQHASRIEELEQHASRIEELEPPTGTAQDGSVVGG